MDTGMDLGIIDTKVRPTLAWTEVRLCDVLFADLHSMPFYLARDLTWLPLFVPEDNEGVTG